jgi:hypothetical protein
MKTKNVFAAKNRLNPNTGHKMLIMLIISFSVLALSGISFAAPQLQVDVQKYEPYPAQTDQYLNLWVYVKNLDTYAPVRDISISIISSFPFSIDSNNAVQTIGSLEPYGDAVVQFKNIRIAADALDGWNKLKVKYTSSGSSITKEIDIYVKSLSANLVVGSLGTAPSEILPDTKNLRLDLELQNVGKGNAEMVTGKLILPSGFTATDSYSDSFSFGTIEKDTSKTGKFYIDISKDIRSGSYTANLTLQYKEQNSEDFKNVVVPVALNVKPSPVFSFEKISVSTESGFGGPLTAYAVAGSSVITPSTLAQGEKGELRITLKNTGDKESKSTSVRIFKQSDQPFEFDTKYDYIGDLQPNQTADAVFSFTIDKTAVLKAYLLSAEIRYVEGEDVKVTDQPFTIEVAKQLESPVLLYAVILVVIIIAVVLGWKYAKRK